MKDNKNQLNHNRYFKIWGIFWALTISYVMLHFTNGELYISRFEGPFLGYIELFLHGHISLDNFNFFPMLNPESLPVDASLPDKIQGIMRSEAWIPNTVSIFIMLVYITGISPHQLMVLPLGVFFFPVVILSILKHAPKDKVLNEEIVRVAVYYIIFFIVSRYYGSLYVAVFATMLVFVILLCMISISRRNIIPKSFWIVFIILTFSLAQYWHSMLMMTLFIIISLWVIQALLLIYNIHINKLRHHTFSFANNMLFPVSSYLLLIAGIIALTFTHIWESSYVSVVVDNLDIGAYLDLLLSKLSGKVAFPVPYVYSYKSTIFGQLYFMSFLGIVISCSFILIISIITRLISSHKNDKYNFASDFPLILGTSLIISQIIYSIAYFNTHSINFPLAFLFFPIGALLIYATLKESDKQTKLTILYQKLFNGILMVMVFLSFVMVITCDLTNEAGNTPLTKYDDTKSSFTWLFNKIDSKNQLIVDFNILGKYVQREAQISEPTLKYRDLDPDTYSMWVGDECSIPISLKNSISVVDERTMSGNLPIQVTGSRAALKQELNKIDTSINLKKIYTDGFISLFTFI